MKNNDPPETKDTRALEDEETMAALAAVRAVSVLKKMEGAYESLLNLLPKRHTGSTEHDDRGPFHDHGAQDYETPIPLHKLRNCCCVAF
jgi:hypothetical protein